jgi:hypothetical protein
MEDFDLLEHVQPADGWFCVLGIKGKSIHQELVKTRAEVDTEAAKFLAAKRNVFFALAKFKTNKDRTGDNVQSLKSFWLDLDCAPGKEIVNEETGRPDGYADKGTGLAELMKFCKTVGLSKPTIINSGRGFHVYWALEEEIGPKEWKVVATRFRDICFKQDMYVDGNVFDTSRILRIPGTLNFKQDPPLPVEVIHVAPAIKYADFKDLLGITEEDFIEAKEPPKRMMSALGQALLDNMSTSFDKIMRAKPPCNQIMDCFKSRATLSEPRWFDVLSIAKFCSDAETSIHKLSKDHPDYDPQETNKKIEHIKGPHSCATFAVNNPGGCDNCPHKGKITNPMALGREVKRAKEYDEEAPYDLAPAMEIDVKTGEHKVSKMPTPPSPYYWTETGMLYAQFGDENPTFIYDHKLYVVKRMTDPDLGDVAVMRLHLPHDGIKEFCIPNSRVTNQVKLKEELSKNGVLSSDAQFKKVSTYVLECLRELQHKRKADIMRTQFGWIDNDTKFLVGEREITVDGVYHAPPSDITKSMTPLFEPKGNLEEWKKAFALYGRPGMEIHAFAALSGFGSAMLKFTEQKGAVINLVHTKAGTGKTTILRMVNSICGDPEGLLGTPDDTAVARINKIGILRNVSNTVDELTNLEGKDLSDVLYAFSQGKGKDKGDLHQNKLRVNTSTWRTMTVSSSNASFIQKLSTLKNVPDGEYMRLLEFKIGYTAHAIVSTQEGKDIFDHKLNNNYGHAIVPFIQWAIANLNEYKDTLLKVQKKIDKELNLTQRERNWSAMVATNITCGLFAHRLGLLPGWDMQNIYKEVVRELNDMRKETTAPVGGAIAVLGEYINRHNNNLLIINDGVDLRSNAKSFPIREPKGELFIRHEPDTGLWFVNANHFKTDCGQTQIDYKDTIKELKAKGVFLKSVTKRIAKGMIGDVKIWPVYCLVFDGKNSEFETIKDGLPTGEDDGEGGAD